MSAQVISWENQTIDSGRYHVLHKLARGGFGDVYLAQDSRLDREVVLKAPRLFLLEEEDFTERYQREIRSMIRLSHPHIVRIYDVGEHQKHPFTILEYIPGGTLEQHIQTNGGTGLNKEIEFLAHWLPQIASALDFMHKRKYIHRDIKPSNIMFDSEEPPHPYLTDFGIVKVVDDSELTLTANGQAMGTGCYMAPEICKGSRFFDGRVDQYSLAVTVYESVIGECPIRGSSAQATMYLQTQEIPIPLIEKNSAVPRSFSDAVARALSKEPEDRYGSCTEFADAVLAHVLTQQSSIETPVSSSVDSQVFPAVETPTSDSKEDSYEGTQDQSSESLRLQCPSCNRKLKLGRERIGKRLKCPGCSMIMKVSESGELTLIHTETAGHQIVTNTNAKKSQKSPQSTVFQEPGSRKQEAESVKGTTPNSMTDYLNPLFVTRNRRLVIGGIAGAVLLLFGGTIIAVIVGVNNYRQAAKNAIVRNNMKQIGLAMHNFHDIHGAFPFAAHSPPQNETRRSQPDLLSWRVELLPLLAEADLYSQFHLNEAWDSPHNIKLLEKMPDVFKHPKTDSQPGKTLYRLIQAPGALYEGGIGRSLRDVTDGSFNTIMVSQASNDHFVEWTKPDAFEVNLKLVSSQFLPNNSSDGKYFLFLYVDGSVRRLLLKDPLKDTGDIKKAITRNGE